MSHDTQHLVEFGGSKVAAEFDGTLSFRLIDRIPLITVSHAFWTHTARQIRYFMMGSLEGEKPFHHAYNCLVLDVRMVSEYRDDVLPFLEGLREELRGLGGDLVLVTYQPEILPQGIQSFETIDEAVAAAKAARRRR